MYSFGDSDPILFPNFPRDCCAPLQAPYDFMMRGIWEGEELGLALIRGYHLEVLHMEQLGSKPYDQTFWTILHESFLNCMDRHKIYNIYNI